MIDYNTLQKHYGRLNEGLGGAYERIAYSNHIKRIARQHNCKKILELNATYIAGIPGFNSCLLAREPDFEITITVNSRDYEDTVKAWQMLGLYERVKIYKFDSDIGTPFDDNTFDMVWNHLAFEHFQDPSVLVREMKRVSNNVVLNLTLSPYNLGFGIHYLNHKLQGKHWDHGYIKNTTIGAMEKVHKQEGLIIIENGACDIPPWMDTVDGKMGDSMTYLDFMPGFMKNNWSWCSANPECRDHWLVNFLWSLEATMPKWFAEHVAHHLFVASRKNNRLL